MLQMREIIRRLLRRQPDTPDRAVRKSHRAKQPAHADAREQDPGSWPEGSNLPRTYFERVADDYEPRPGEEVCERFVGRQSLGRWRVIRRAAEKEETASEDDHCKPSPSVNRRP